MSNSQNHISKSSSDDRGSSDQTLNSSQGENSLNSLFRLNEYCLRDISNCVNMETLCRLTDVCTELRSIAEKAFSKVYMELSDKEYQLEDTLFYRILFQFGHLIASNVFMPKRFYSKDEINAIVKHCPNLKVFRIHPLNDFEFNVKALPKLVELEFRTATLLGAWSPLAFAALLQLLKLNPQLQELKIEASLNDAHLEAMLQHTKNLGVLQIKNVGMEFSEKGFMQLSQQKKLKNFKYISNNPLRYDENIAISLMAAFSKGKVNLEYLHLDGLSINSDGIKSILNFKTIEHLYLGSINCLPDDLTSLVNGLPLLKMLQLKFNKDFSSILVSQLIKMVEAGKQLNQIDLHFIQHFKIDQKVFKALLKAASNRLNQNTLIIDILGFATMVDVAKDIQHTNRQLLQIKHQKLPFMY